MTLEKAVNELVSLGVISKIGSEYFITSKAYEVLDELEVATNTILLDAPIKVNEYPEVIQKASSKKKVKAILDYCNVPLVTSGETSYVLRSEDGFTRNEINRIMADPEVDPTILLKSISDYYEFMQFPKGFRRYVHEGDILSVYQWYKEGNKFTSESIPDNLLWD